jgi:hypothetical protein
MPLLENGRRLLAGAESESGAGFGSGWIFVATMDQLIAKRSLKRMEGRKAKGKKLKTIEKCS